MRCGLQHARSLALSLSVAEGFWDGRRCELAPGTRRNVSDWGNRSDLLPRTPREGWESLSQTSRLPKPPPHPKTVGGNSRKAKWIGLGGGGAQRRRGFVLGGVF